MTKRKDELTAAVLESPPLLARAIWYALWRNIRIRHREMVRQWEHELLHGTGTVKPVGILNTTSLPR